MHIFIPSLIILCALFATPRFAAAYDPLAIPETVTAAEPVDLDVFDVERQREIPVRVYLPVGKSSATPVLLFSHGLGGSRAGSAYLGKHWAARGYVAVFLQHPGSDEAVWRGLPPREIFAAMNSKASVENFMLRVRDVSAVLDRLGEWNGEEGHLLRSRLDLDRVGMAGHSFGAITTQAVSGQRARAGMSLADPRIKAALVMSPSVPRRGDAKSAFGEVTLPWLLMTGTHDIARIGNQTIGAADMESRLGVYPALPEGGKYELVLHEADHFAFTERSEMIGEANRNPNHHRAILALSTAFWDSWLRGDAAARTWLDGEGARSVLESEDRWQRK